MSRRERENQDSQSTRPYSSRSNRNPSPNKTRRDMKQGAERMYSNSSRFDTDTHDHRDRDRSDRRRVQDALHLKAPPSTETKRHSESMKDGPEKKVDMHTQVARSQHFLQHDERRYGGQSFTGRSTDKMEERKSWRHDGYFELEKNAERKRPAFREKKMEAPSQALEAAVHEGREGRVHYSHENRSERAFSRPDDRNIRRRGMDNTTIGIRPQVEKWKHDLFEDANKSPDSKNEDDEIAKIEALLAL